MGDYVHHHTEMMADHAATAAVSSMEMHMDMSCKMNMAWNYDTNGICLVFPSLRIHSTPTLLFYLIFLFILSVFYELMRLRQSSYDRGIKSTLRAQRVLRREMGSTSTSQARRSISPEVVGDESIIFGMRLPYVIQLRRSALYTLNVTIAFYLMLIIMTYNAFLIGAVLLGAFVGHFVFHRTIDLSVSDDDGKGAACH